jgi:hypothetical protein
MVDMVDVSNDEQSQPDKPEGADFKITLNGRRVWFKKMSESQRITLSRIERRMHRRLREIRDTPGSSPDEILAKLRASDDQVDMLYQRIWDAVDSTIIDPADQEFLEESMLTGKLAMSDAMRVFRQGADEPQPDDAEIVPKPRPARPAKKAAAAKKSVANAQRTKR